jgi:hypothetical protein
MGVVSLRSDQKIIRLGARRIGSSERVWAPVHKCLQRVLTGAVALSYYEFFCDTRQRTFSKILALVDYEEEGYLPALWEPQLGEVPVCLLRHHFCEERVRTESAALALPLSG